MNPEKEIWDELLNKIRVFEFESITEDYPTRFYKQLLKSKLTFLDSKLFCFLMYLQIYMMYAFMDKITPCPINAT